MNLFKRITKFCDEEIDMDGTSSGISKGAGGLSRQLDLEIAQLTRLRSGPSEKLSRMVQGRCKAPISTVKMLAAREGNYSGRGRLSSADICHVTSRYLPVHGPHLVDEMDSYAYVSQFSDDGSLLVAAFQGSHIKIYDVENRWKVRKDIIAKSLRWTITDTSLSPNQIFLVSSGNCDICYKAYSSMSPLVRIVNVGSFVTESVANVTEIHEELDFTGEDYDEDEDAFGIFSVKFSTDGREIVAASSDKSIYVYDLAANKLCLRIHAHEADVNTVCFADESGNLMYSGSDDYLCKVWDRRCLNAKREPAGILTGHLEGITFINSRGDERYFISNGKDQCTKLWDIRKMSSNATCAPRLRNFDWDYRYMEYPMKLRGKKHPNDQSVSTYKGHSVLRTLIRCYFSPAYSTGQKYIYSGSNDACVYIYDLVSGVQVAKLEPHDSTVRDCSWHPYYPMIVSSSWDGMIQRSEFPEDGEAPKPRRRSSRRSRHFLMA